MQPSQHLHNLLGSRYTPVSPAQQPLSTQTQPQQPGGRVASPRNLVLCNTGAPKQQQTFDSCQNCQKLLDYIRSVNFVNFANLWKGLRNSIGLPYDQTHFHCCLLDYLVNKWLTLQELIRNQFWTGQMAMG